MEYPFFSPVFFFFFFLRVGALSSSPGPGSKLNPPKMLPAVERMSPELWLWLGSEWCEYSGCGDGENIGVEVCTSRTGLIRLSRFSCRCALAFRAASSFEKLNARSIFEPLNEKPSLPKITPCFVSVPPEYLKVMAMSSRDNRRSKSAQFRQCGKAASTAS